MRTDRETLRELRARAIGCGLGRWLTVSVGVGLLGCALPPLPPDAINVSVPADNVGPGDANQGDNFIDWGDLDEKYVPVTCVESTVDRSARPPRVGDLVISEVFANPTGADLFGDWIEIYVAATEAVDLNDVLILHTAAGEPERRIELNAWSCRSVVPDQYFVIGASEDPLQNGGVPVDWAPSLVQLYNIASRIELRIGNWLIDGIDLPTPLVGVSIGLDPTSMTAAANDDPAALCPGSSTGIFDEVGTPGVNNDPCP